MPDYIFKCKQVTHIFFYSLWFAEVPVQYYNPESIRIPFYTSIFRMGNISTVRYTAISIKVVYEQSGKVEFAMKIH
jgi:hypothetical protein